MSKVKSNDLEAASTEDLQLKTFKNKPKRGDEINDFIQAGTKRKSLQSLIAIEPEPIPSSKNNSILYEDGIIQPEPNFIPMINSLLDDEVREGNSGGFMTDFDSVEGASTINRLFFPNDSSNIVLIKLLKLRSFINRINVSKFPIVYNNVTYLHILLLIMFTVANLLYFKYARRNLMSKNKLIATLIATSMLNGVSDVIAQTIVCSFVSKSTQNSSNNYINNGINLTQGSRDNSNQADYVELDLEDLEYQQSLLDDESLYLLEDINHKADSDFQLWRLMCFAMWGAFMANFQVPWYFILNKLFAEDPTAVQILERILSDQLFYSPISLYFFFAFANYVMDAGDVASFRNKLKKIYLNTLMINYLLWPLMQFINFSFIPKDDQPLFSSCVSVVWNVILSMRNASTK